MCKFQVNHLKNKRDLKHRKSWKWKVFWRLPEVDESVSGRPNIFWYYKRDLINWYRFGFKIKILKISDIFYIYYHFLWRPELTDDMFNPIVHVYQVRSIIPENFKSLSLVVSEKKGGHEKTEIGRIPATGSEFSKNKNIVSSSCHR